MVPLRFEWGLSSPLAGMALPLHLDALVAFAMTEQALNAGEVSDDIRSLAKDLPLSKLTRDGEWVWQASALRPSDAPRQGVVGHETRLWTRKTDEYDYAERVVSGQIATRLIKFDKAGNPLAMKPFTGNIDTQRGLMKNHFQFIPARRVNRVVAWCVGDEDRLLELLHPDSGLVTHIGARGRSGFGQIVDFHYEHDESAYQQSYKRVLPWQETGTVEITAACHNPYWAIENRRTCYVDPGILG